MLGQIKNLTKHSAIYSVGTFIQRALGLVLLPILTDTTYLVMNVVYLYGIDSAFLRFYFIGKHSKEDIYRTTIQLLSLTAIITSVILFLLSEPLSIVIFNDHGYQFFIKMAAAILFFDTLCNIPYLLLRAEERSVLYTSIRLGRFILELLFNLIFIVGLRLGVKGILYANLIYLAVEMSHRYLMLYLLDKNKVGEYGANYKFGTLMLLLVTGFRTAWQPFFLKIAHQDDAKRIYARVMTYFVFGSALVVLIGSLFIEYIVKIPVAPGKTLMGKEYWGGVFIIPLILLSYLFYGIYVNLTVGIYIEKKSQLMFIFTGLAALTNIGFNLYLIPTMGMIGAALATLIAYLVMMLSIFIANQKIYPVPYEYTRLAMILSYVIISLVIYYFFAPVWYIRLVLIMAIPILVFGVGFFKQEEKIFITELISKIMKKQR